MSFATVNDRQIAKASVVLPLVGIWTAEVTYDKDSELPATGLTLKFGSLSMLCSRRRGGNFAGGRMDLLYGGTGGWRKTIPARFYQLGQGIRLALVVSDAALECGEAANVTADRVVGLSYTRQEAPAARVLNDLAESWFVDAKGVCTVGPRDPASIRSKFSVLNFDPALGLAEVATDAPEDWIPGRLFQIESGSFSVRSVRHIIEHDKVRTMVSTQ